MSFEQDLKRARLVGAPLIAIQTADQRNTIQQVCKTLNGDTPILVWDVIKGVTPATKKSQAAWITFLEGKEENKDATVSLSMTLQLSEHLLIKDGVLIIANAHRQLEQIEILQGIMNLRDPFKGDRR